MDFSNFKNSVTVMDQSVLQQIGFTLTQNNPIDVFGFLEKQKITIYAPAEAKNELGFQVYSPNLLSGTYSDANSTITAEEGALNTNYVLSQINGSLTPANLQPNGFNVTLIESNVIYSSTFERQLSIWDSTPMIQKLARNKRSTVDYLNILLARYFQKKREKVFVFTNDQEQIKQLKCEGIKYLRPDKLFAWMCEDGFIDPRKNAWNFKKRRGHNERWTNSGKKI